MRTLLASIVGILIVGHSKAATWNATATRASINSALSSASAGDTINIAAGTVTSGTVMSITKGINIVGAGTNSTIIQGRAFSIALSGADARVELSHFKITGPATESAGAISFPDTGDVHEDQFVAHDLFITGHWSAFDVDYEGAHGVVYNCTLTGNEHHGYFGGYTGAIQNHTAPPWAWNQAHYFTYEDCSIGPTSPEQIMFVTEYPYPYMIRYSAITERSGFPQCGDMHGGGGANDNVGVVLNNNSIDLDNDGFFIEIRGGGYCLVYDNVTTGAGTPSIELDANCPSQCDDTHHTYIWGNAGFAVGSDGNQLNVAYFLSEPASFDGLAYPHPLRGPSEPPVPDTNAPSVPAGLTAVAAGSDRNQLTWTASSDNIGVVGYDIYRDGQLRAQTSGIGTTYTDTGLAPETQYCYRIRARDTQNQSGQSNEDCATTDADVSPPAGSFFVDRTHANASDGNPGTEAQPWATITKANQALRAGDTVYIKGGTYNSYVSPQNSGTPSAPIIYQNYPGHTVRISGTAYAVRVDGKSWIQVSGIHGTNCNQYLFLTKATNNTIAQCTFIGNTAADWTASLIGDDSRSNRVLNCTFAKWGSYSTGDDVGSPLDIGNEDSDSNDLTQFNLLEGCTLYHGGHHLLGVFGKYNIIRNNYLHNEIWLSGYGNRCVWVHGHPATTGWNLFEGNRIAYSADPVDNIGAQGMLVASSTNIIRRNLFYKNNVSGLMFSWSSYATSPSGNRVYHNTFFDNYHYPDSSQTDPALEAGIGIAHYGSGSDYQNFPIRGNAFVNNLMYENPLAFGYYISSSAPAAERDGIVTNQVYAGNWTETGNPLFVNAPFGLGNPFNDGLDLSLRTNSPCIDAGVYLTTITSLGGSGTTVSVGDATFFVDGWGMIEGDLVQLQGQSTPARLVSVNYAANTLTFDHSVNWTTGQGVSLAYGGNAPEVGALELDADGAPLPPQRLRIVPP